MTTKLSESELLIIKQLINYANLPVTKRAMMDPVSGEFLFLIRRRPGCPLSEKQLQRDMSDHYRRYIRESVSDSTSRTALRRLLPQLSIDALKQQLERVIAECK